MISNPEDRGILTEELITYHVCNVLYKSIIRELSHSEHLA